MLPLLSISCCAWGIATGMIAALLRAAPFLGDIVPDAEVLAGGLAGAGTLITVNALIVGPFSWFFLGWAEERIDRVERAKVSRAEQRHQRFQTVLNELADERADEELEQNRR